MDIDILLSRARSKQELGKMLKVCIFVFNITMDFFVYISNPINLKKDLLEGKRRSSNKAKSKGNKKKQVKVRNKLAYELLVLLCMSTQWFFLSVNSIRCWSIDIWKNRTKI